MSLYLNPIPTLQRFSRNDPNDRRMGEIIHFPSENLPDITLGDICLVGFPEDRGVIRNHGREGSSEAPDRIREMFYRLPASNMEYGIENFDRYRIFDLGNIQTGNSLPDAQKRLGEVVGWILLKGGIPVVLGGGHETAYGHFLGYVEARKEVSVVNFDAHLDVREIPSDGTGTSGTPFRQMIQHPSGLLSGYWIFGAQPNANSAAYVRFAEENRIRLNWLSAIQKEIHPGLLPGKDDSPVYLTIDIDGFGSAWAPGCSAPQVTGLTPDLMFPVLERLGKSSRVTSLDICEVNPVFDRDNQTSKLAAMLIYQFISGHFSSGAAGV